MRIQRRWTHVTLAWSASAFVALALPLASATGQDSAGVGRTESLGAALERLRGTSTVPLPDAAAFVSTAVSVAAGQSVNGPVATDGAPIDVYGIVAGDAVARGGDIVVHRGGLITGNAVAIAGRVRFDGGTVRGAVVTLDDLGPATAPLSPRDRALRNLTVVGVSALILLVIGLGVVANASDNLQAVADALERQYGRSLIAGLAGQAAFLPLLVVICLALVLSVIGILLVPFAAVVYGIVAAGLVTIGLLATAVVIGRGWRAAPVPTGRSQKAATVRAMALGIGAISAPFAAAALFAPWPQAEPFARATAIAAGWVACTAGLGAAIVSRAGIRRIRPPQLERALATASWQTPTPVTGVAAARRPAAMPTPSRPQ